MQMSPGSRGTLLTFLLLVVGVTAPFVVMIRPYFLALLMGLILAVLCHPVFIRLRGRGLSPVQSGLAVSLSLLLLVLVPLLLFMVAAARQGIALFNLLSTRQLLSYQSLLDQVLSWEPLSSLIGHPDEVLSKLAELATTALSAVSGLLFRFVAEVPELLLQILLGLFASFYFLVDGPRLLRWLGSKTPLSRATRRELFRCFRETAVAVLVASMAAASVQSVLMFAAFLTLSVPGAFLAAGTTFVFAWIPLLGSTPVWATGAIILWAQGATGKAAILVIIGLVTGVSDNIVRPLILQGRGEEMHPLLSLVSIFGGLAMFGITGVFVGPILAAMVVAVFNAWPQVALEHGIPLDGTEPGPLSATSDATLDSPGAASP